MLKFRVVELLRRFNFGLYVAKGPRALDRIKSFLEILFCLNGDVPLSFVIVVDSRAVLGACVVSLSEKCCRIVPFKEYGQDFLKRYLLRVIDQTDNFVVVCQSGADFRVRRVLRDSLSISYVSGVHSLHPHEYVFRAPEATHSERDHLSLRGERGVQRRIQRVMHILFTWSVLYHCTRAFDAFIGCKHAFRLSGAEEARSWHPSSKRYSPR
mmetsp:Transcript_34250/g.55545  ORF Transcript_34250/g.55545 Transcript_34250/m.55545 type:complete len:211 (+) Transcript_34250:260-892(+)